jgi:hypothetical protein
VSTPATPSEPFGPRNSLTSWNALTRTLGSELPTTLHYNRQARRAGYRLLAAKRRVR